MRWCSDSVEIHYTLDHVIGSGSVSTVYRASLKSKGRLDCFGINIPGTVALKRIRKDAVLQESVNAEYELMSKISHPNCVRLYEAFQNSDCYCIVMELLTGHELFEAIAVQHPFSELEASKYVKEVASGLMYLHENKIVHRDIKPENLMFASKDTSAPLKIIDFGVSVDISTFSSNEPLSESIGTIGYVAPELLKGFSYGTPIDMWALGVILYNMLSGFMPFLHASDQVHIEMIRNGVFDFEDEAWIGVSSEAKDLVRKLLCVDAAKRFTAAQVMEHPWIVDPKSCPGSTLLRGTSFVENYRPRKNSKLKNAVMKLRSVAMFNPAIYETLKYHNKAVPDIKHLTHLPQKETQQRGSLFGVLMRCYWLVVSIVGMFWSVIMSRFIGTSCSNEDLMQYVQRRVSMPIPNGRMLSTDIARMYAVKSIIPVHDKKRVILVVPGVVGSVDLFLTMLSSIYEYYDAQMSVLVIGHGGHSKWSLPLDRQAISLREQIDLKVALLRGELNALKDSGEDNDIFEIFVISYGIGTHIALEMRDRLPEYNFVKVFGVSPTLFPSGTRSPRKAFRNMMSVQRTHLFLMGVWYYAFCARMLLFFVPTVLKISLLRKMLATQVPQVEDEFYPLLLELVDPDILQNIQYLRMDQEGTEHQNKWIRQLRDRFMFLLLPGDDPLEGCGIDQLRLRFPNACFDVLPQNDFQSVSLSYGNIDFTLERVLESVDTTEFEF